jgi:capsular exopolysaccharide synthesis family protein
MERIRKAIEQAGQERALNQAHGHARPASSAASTEAPASPGATSDFTGRFPYRQTKRVEVSDQLMLDNRLIAGVDSHALTDAYKMLRTRALQVMRAKGWNAIAVTGPATGCGKSLTAINLAISLAREVTHTVLLVDLDFRNPSIHRYFGYEPQYGISDYLFHDVPVSELLFTPSIDRLVVLPGREVISNSAEMLRSPKMVALVNELKTRYPDRIVIFDLPPVLQADDALAFSPYADAMLVVAENGGTQREDLKQALDVLKDTPILGTILNKTEVPTGGYYRQQAPRRWWQRF